MQFDWKVEKGTNSGLLYHILETTEASYETGPEYQLIDDVGFDGKLEDWLKAGLIDLQDYGGGIWFKNLKLKLLSTSMESIES